MSKLPPLPEGSLLDSPSHIDAPPPALPPTPLRDDEDATDAPAHPPYCLRSVYSNHVADLLNGLPPARYGVGRDYLETDPDNPIPWAITDAVYLRVAHSNAAQINRKALLQRHTPLLRPCSPTHRDDFPRPPPDGDPQPSTNSPYPSRADDSRWTREERSAFLVEAMIPQFPPNTKGVVATRRWTTGRPQPSSDNLTGMQPELDAMVGVHALQTRRYEAFHVEWAELQRQLRTKAQDLRAEYARVYEDVGRLHHLYIRNRMEMAEYKPLREALVQQLDGTFATVGMVANTTGALYAVGRAVAQGVSRPGGFVYGKLDVAACDAVPFLRSIFPEFAVKKKPSNPTPVDPMAPEPYELPFQEDLPSYDFEAVMAVVWRNHPTKLQDIHRAVVERCFEGVEELTQRERSNVGVLLGKSGQWIS